MIKGIYQYLTLVLVAVVLTGCMSPGEKHPAPVETIKPDKKQPEPTVPPLPKVPQQPGPIIQPEPTIPTTPRVRTYNWEGTMQPLVGKMLKAEGLDSGSVLLVDSVNNRTNGSLQTSKATEALQNALANNGKFTLVSPQQLALAKQQLGLSSQDSLGSRSKAIGIARNVGAQYVIYTSASGNVSTPALKMQLMLVQTGEIIWSGSGDVQQTH